MQIIELHPRPSAPEDSKARQIHTQLGQLLQELADKPLADDVATSINQDVQTLNAAASLSDPEWAKLAKKKQTQILKLLEQKAKLTPQNHYRTLWMVVGMSGFGLPIGVAIGLAVGNIGLLAVGLPIGMAIGIAVGTAMDKKAFDEGRQLHTEIKH